MKHQSTNVFVILACANSYWSALSTTHQYRNTLDCSKIPAQESSRNPPAKPSPDTPKTRTPPQGCKELLTYREKLCFCVWIRPETQNTNWLPGVGLGGAWAVWFKKVVFWEFRLVQKPKTLRFRLGGALGASQAAWLHKVVF